MSDKPCAVDGCHQIARSRGWCKTHYARWSRHGHPLGTAKEPMPAVSAPGESVDPCDVVGCDKRKERGKPMCPKHWKRRRSVELDRVGALELDGVEPLRCPTCGAVVVADPSAGESVIRAATRNHARYCQKEAAA